MKEGNMSLSLVQVATDVGGRLSSVIATPQIELVDRLSNMLVAVSTVDRPLYIPRGADCLRSLYTSKKA